MNQEKNQLQNTSSASDYQTPNVKVVEIKERRVLTASPKSVSGGFYDNTQVGDPEDVMFNQY